MKNPFILHCYARPEGKYYIGVCLELFLVTKGRSITEVRRKMDDAIKSYVGSLDRDNFADLFPRYAPFLYQLDYQRVKVMTQYYKTKKQIKQKFEIFVEQIRPKEFTLEKTSCLLQ